MDQYARIIASLLEMLERFFRQRRRKKFEDDVDAIRQNPQQSLADSFGVQLHRSADKTPVSGIEADSGRSSDV